MATHKNYAVLCYELNGKRLGRLTPEGGTTNRKIYAAILSRETASEIATAINAGGNFKAKVIPF